MKIKEIADYLESIAPLNYQEDYDNCGLIVGEENESVKSVLITLDCTLEVVNEAIEKACNLIIAHHPIIFGGIKKLNGKSDVEKAIMQAIKHNIAIYAIHTNLDNVMGGVSSKIANHLGLGHCKILAPKRHTLRQLAVFCPISATENVKQAMFLAGAGNIGKYDECSFSTHGIGTFRANADCNPYVGKIGERHTEKEEKIEVIFPINKEREVVSAMKNAHPYEEVAYQIYVLENEYEMVGSGIVGELPQEMVVETFFSWLKEKMQTECIRHSPLIKKNIKRVAICGGSGSFLIKNAKQAKADVFITADVKYHEFFAAENDIIIADIGHFESEQFTKQLIFDLLKEKFPKFAAQLSEKKTNPINYFK